MINTGYAVKYNHYIVMYNNFVLVGSGDTTYWCVVCFIFHLKRLCCLDIGVICESSDHGRLRMAEVQYISLSTRTLLVRCPHIYFYTDKLISTSCWLCIKMYTYPFFNSWHVSLLISLQIMMKKLFPLAQYFMQWGYVYAPVSFRRELSLFIWINLVC